MENCLYVCLYVCMYEVYVLFQLFFWDLFRVVTFLFKTINIWIKFCIFYKKMTDSFFKDYLHYIFFDLLYFYQKFVFGELNKFLMFFFSNKFFFIYTKRKIFH